MSKGKIINIATGSSSGKHFPANSRRKTIAISTFARVKKWAIKRPKLQHTYELADYTKFYLQNATQDLGL